MIITDAMNYKTTKEYCDELEQILHRKLIQSNSSMPDVQHSSNAFGSMQQIPLTPNNSWFL